MRADLLLERLLRLPVDDPSDPGPVDRPSAVRAGLGRGVERAACKELKVVGAGGARGEKSGLAKILKDTAVFLKEQKKISDVLPSYAAFVTPDVVIAIEKGAGS